jgi:hypothetical protein
MQQSFYSTSWSHPCSVHDVAEKLRFLIFASWRFTDYPTFVRRKMAYPEQQLPGVPHELGVPQQPPELGSVNFRDELLDVL